MPPYKYRNKNTGELVEFDWQGPIKPTSADINRILAERRSKPVTRNTPNIESSGISTPRFPQQPQAPTFGSELGKFGNWATTSLMPDVEEDVGNFGDKYLGEFGGDAARFITGGATSPLGLATGGIGGVFGAKALRGFMRAAPASKGFSKAADIVAAPPVVNAPWRDTPDDVLRASQKPRVRMLLDDAGKNIGYEPITDLARPAMPGFSPLPDFQELTKSTKPLKVAPKINTVGDRIHRSTRPTGGFSVGKNTGIGTADLGQLAPLEVPPGVIGPASDVKSASKFTEAINFPKGALTIMDLSAPLRQGKGLIHKKEFWTSLKPMFQSLVSEEGFKINQEAIKKLPTFSLMQKHNPGLTDLLDITKREEAIMSSWIEKIPGARASNRAYTGFLNNLRANSFNSMVEAGEKAGTEIASDPNKLGELADFIANATGRGSLGPITPETVVKLNNVFFSPRFIASRVHFLNPVNYVKASPEIRKEMVKSVLAGTTYWATTAGLANLAGATIETDPTSSDFAKFKVGNTRVDTLAGFQQYLRAGAQFLYGQKKSPTSNKVTNLGEGYRAPTRLDVALDFTRSKMSPVAGFAWDLAKGRTIAGKPIKNEMKRLDSDNYIVNMFTPMVARTLSELYQEDPSLFNSVAGAASIFGEGVQVFDEPISRPTRRQSNYAPY